MAEQARDALASRILDRKRLVYGIAGALLSIGAPLGLLMVHLGGDGILSFERIRERIASDRATYIYVTMSTAIVFTVFGAVLGGRTDRLAALANTDPLTGLANARVLNEHLRRELNRAARYRQPLALLLIDVDGFKKVNDRFGHAVGDRALRHVGKAIRSQLRESDVGARWGGDEFALLAPGTPVSAAVALAERVRSLVAQSTTDGIPRLSASIGIATFDGGVDADTDADRLKQAADKALYAAKRAGRDRYVIGTLRPEPA
jgi:diguanylate cyclase (GGDEF)-like protein